MTRRRFAIITYDPDRIEQLSYQAEGLSISWTIIQALQGYDYPKERGIINITLLDKLPIRPPNTKLVTNDSTSRAQRRS
ncbi:hypothetical protein [Blastomonas sp. AAP25]|uniref:hypothetical protein n=1 Tax=Blastomonas sp. AAP25 TaxID=1523416 RepID=UPI0012E2F907|nr:hypothetical protein [Blastomonas sp. AAP25]